MPAKKQRPAKGSAKPTGAAAKTAKPTRQPSVAKATAAVSAPSGAASTPGEPDGGQRVRLQRALAAAGFGSRRQCEELILEGRVEVDGQIVDQLGTTIDWNTSKVHVDGTPLKPRRLVYYAVNKPVGVVTTNADPEGRPRVIDLVPPDERVFPVGRLDRSSEGLILLTNDGDLAQRLAHPRYEIQKVYRVTVAGNVQAETIRQMQQGIYIAEGLVRVEGARVLKARARATEMEITLREGKNREIRRILARLGHKVQTLKRIAIGTLRLGEMPTGAYRRLTAEEIKKLKQSTEATQRSGQSAGLPRRPRPAAGAKARPAGKAAGRATPAGKGTPTTKGAQRLKSTPTEKGTHKTRTAAGGRSGQVRSGKPAVAAPLDLPEFGGTRTGSVIGADPIAPKAKPPAERPAKDHVIRPRTSGKGAAGKCGGKIAGKGSAGRPAAGANKKRTSARRRKGSGS